MLTASSEVPTKASAQSIAIRTSLAKLLAREDLTVIHSATAKTAMFNVESRTLMCPLWDKTSERVYSLLLGHEVGHALFTPRNFKDDLMAQWPDPSDHHNAFQVLNILEDVRIDKAIQRVYPGLRVDYSIGYNELFESDFFGTHDPAEIAKLSFLDRLNIHAKVGVRAQCPFTPEEQVLVTRVQAAKTWAEIMLLAKELFPMAPKPFMPPQPEAGQGEEAAGDGESNDSKESQGNTGKAPKAEKKQDKEKPAKSEAKPAKGKSEKSEDKQEPTDKAGDKDADGAESADKSEDESDQKGSGAGDSDESDEDSDQNGGGQSQEDESDDDSEDDDSEDDDSEDDAGGDDSEDESGDDAEAEGGQGDGGADAKSEPKSGPKPSGSKPAPHSKGGVVDAPTAPMGSSQEAFDKALEKASDVGDPDSYSGPLPALQFVEPNVEVFNSLDEAAVPAQIKQLEKLLPLAHQHFAKLKGDAQVMAVTFECHKAAAADARTTESKSGVLNMDRLMGYKWTDDVFLRTTTTPDGKSHGLVMLLDLSSSMAGSISTNDAGETVPGGIFDQIVTLVSFCRLTKIAYQVYGFTQLPGVNVKTSTAKANIPGLTMMPQRDDTSVVRLFDSLDTPAQHKARIDVLTMMWAHMSNVTVPGFDFSLDTKDWSNRFVATHIRKWYNAHRPATRTVQDPETYQRVKAAWPIWLQMGGTPLVEVASWVPSVVKTMQNRGVQIVRTVFVTDGGASGHHAGTSVINDTKSHATIREADIAHFEGKGNQTLTMMLERLRRLTGTEVFNYYLMNRNQYAEHRIKQGATNVSFKGRARRLSRRKAVLPANDRYSVSEDFEGYDQYVAMLFEANALEQIRKDEALLDSRDLSGKKLKAEMLRIDQAKTSMRPLMVSLGKSFAIAMKEEN